MGCGELRATFCRGDTKVGAGIRRSKTSSPIHFLRTTLSDTCLFFNNLGYHLQQLHNDNCLSIPL